MKSLWLIGCGNMAGAMLSRWLATGLDSRIVTIVDPGITRADVRVLPHVPAEPAPDWIMLGVKPQMLSEVAPGLQAATDGALLLSILAGTRISSLAAMFPDVRGVARIMPNLPVVHGKGVVALHDDASVEDHNAVTDMMAPLGLVEWIADEAHFDAVTALSGSGPAFVYRFIDALAVGGAALGLPADQAARIALATVYGALQTAALSQERPAALAEKVASKGGSTRAALDVFDDHDALMALVARALAAAETRNRELAALTDRG